MTAAGSTSTANARDVLFGAPDDAVVALTTSLASGAVGGAVARALGGLSLVTRAAVVRELSTVIAGLLDLNLANVLVAAWRTHPALTAAARRTAGAPDAVEVLDVVDHRINTVHRPYVELFVENARVATVGLELRLGFDVKSLVAVVTHGNLAAVNSGTCDVRASLAVQGLDLAENQAQLDLPAVIPAGRDIRLLHDARPAQPVPPLQRRGR